MRAVHDGLLGQEDSLIVLDHVLRLNVASGGESPAGTTLALVLHRGDLTLRDPVPGGGKTVRSEALLGDAVGEAGLNNDLTKGSAGTRETLHTSHGGEELILSHVGELVDSETSGNTGLDGLLVHASDTGLARAVVVVSVRVLFNRRIHLVVLALIALKLQKQMSQYRTPKQDWEREYTRGEWKTNNI